MTKPAVAAPVSDAFEARVLEAVKAGLVTRAQLMSNADLRVMSWDRVGQALKALVKRRVLVQTKDGWRLT